MDGKKLEMLLSKVGDLGLRDRVRKVIEYLDIRKGDRVLDCGCGEGFYSMVVSELFDAEVVALDFDRDLLEMASSWDGNRKIRFLKGDISGRLPFDDNFFDKIIFSEVVEHIDNEEKAVSEVHRVLKPGGIAAITVPNARYPFFWDPLNWVREGLGLGHFNAENTVLGGVWSYGHKRLYTPERIMKVAERAGFRVLGIQALTSYCFPFNYHVLRLGKLFYTKLPVSEKTRKSMEKFEWKEQRSAGFVKAALKILGRYDAKNSKSAGAGMPSVSIALRLEK